LRRCLGHADIMVAMTTNTPAKIVHFDIRSIEGVRL